MTSNGLEEELSEQPEAAALTDCKAKTQQKKTEVPSEGTTPEEAPLKKKRRKPADTAELPGNGYGCFNLKPPHSLVMV